jgi:hypothetical protein
MVSLGQIENTIESIGSIGQDSELPFQRLHKSAVYGRLLLARAAKPMGDAAATIIRTSSKVSDCVLVPTAPTSDVWIGLAGRVRPMEEFPLLARG